MNICSEGEMRSLKFSVLQVYYILYLTLNIYYDLVFGLGQLENLFVVIHNIIDCEIQGFRQQQVDIKTIKIYYGVDPNQRYRDGLFKV